MGKEIVYDKKCISCPDFEQCKIYKVNTITFKEEEKIKCDKENEGE